MKPIKMKNKDANKRVVFSNEWDAQGGPNFTGFVEIMLRNGQYFTIVSNEAITPKEKFYGPYETLDKALDDQESAACIVGPGTVEICCTEMPVAAILNRLRVYIPDVNCEDAGEKAWKIEVNGKGVLVSAKGFKIEGKINRGKTTAHRQ